MSRPFESFFKEIGADMVKTYKDLDQDVTRDLDEEVMGALSIFMEHDRTDNSWVSRASRPYSLEEVQELCDILLYVCGILAVVPAAHAESLQTLFSILDKAELRFRNIKKTITIRTVYQRRSGAESPLKETRHAIDAQHTLQQAVRDEYPLPGVCKTVRLVKHRTRREFSLWDQSEETKILFRDKNLYFEIGDGDTVVIALTAPEDELPPSGPAAGAEDLVPARRCPSVTLQEMRACLGESMIY
jgi:hypothetical protein